MKFFVIRILSDFAHFQNKKELKQKKCSKVPSFSHVNTIFRKSLIGRLFFTKFVKTDRGTKSLGLPIISN